MDANGSKESLWQKLGQEAEDPKFADILVKVEGVEFKCHKIVLAANSDFFNRLFLSDMKEMRDGRVVLHGVSHGTFNTVFRWMYYGDTILTLENIAEVVSAADQLLLGPMFAECRRFITEQMSIKTCIEFYCLCQTYNWLRCDAAAWKLMMKNFDSLEKEDICSLPFESMKNLLESLSLETYSEDNVVSAILEWIKAVPDEQPGNDVIKEKEAGDSSKTSENSEDCEANAHDDTLLNDMVGSLTVSHERPTKADLLVELLKSSRYLLVSDMFLWKHLHVNSTIQSNAKCRDLLSQILRYKTLQYTHQDSCPMAAIYRDCFRVMNVIVAIENGYLVFMPVGGPYSGWCKIKIEPKSTETHSFSAIVYCNGSLYTRCNQMSQISSISISKMPCDKTSQVGPTTETAEEIIHDAVIDTHEAYKCQETVTDTPGDYVTPCIHIKECWRGDTLTLSMSPIGDKLYAGFVNGDGGFNIDSRLLTITSPSIWTIEGRSITKNCEVACVTNHAFNILFFWKNPHNNSLTVESFDINKKRSCIINKEHHESPGVKAFKDGDLTFLLHNDGVVFSVQSLDQAPGVALQREIQLWTGHLSLAGTLLVAGELLVFEDPAVSRSEDFKLNEPALMDGVFTSVRILPGTGSTTRYIHAVVAKRSR